MDNSPNCYLQQLANGIPILDFEDDDLDTELLSLLQYIEALSQKDNKVSANKQYFKLNKMRREKDWSKALSVFISKK